MRNDLIQDTTDNRSIICPNPLHDRASIKITLDKAGKYSLELYDVKGQLLKILSTGGRGKGQFIFEWNATGLTKGLYFVKLVSEGEVVTKSALVY